MNETKQSGPAGLRGDRRPGYCWQENELYDVFLPIIGALPALIYARMTRDCIEAGEAVDFSLRAIAEQCGVSKDTVSRAAIVMEHVGMLRVERRGEKRTPIYRLADLKDLVIDLGGAFHRKQKCHLLPVAVSDRLRGEIKALNCRSQRQAARRKPSAASDDVATDLSLYSDRSVAVSDTHLLIGKTKTKDKNPPTPLASKGGEKDLPAKNEKALALDRLVGRSVEVLFTGVAKDFDNYLLSTRPTRGTAASGPDDWRTGQFRELAVVDCRVVGEHEAGRRVLVLSSPDPPATRRMLEKYHSTWDRLLRKWYGRSVELEVVAQSPRSSLFPARSCMSVYNLCE